MKNWIVTRKSDGAIVYRYQSEEAVEWVDFPFAEFDHTEEVQPEPPAEPVVPRRITRRAFWTRLPSTNFVAMQAIMRSGSPALLAGQLGAMQLLVSDSPFVDLALSQTIDSLIGPQGLSSAAFPATVTIDGVTLPLRLTQAQAEGVLNAEIQPQEVFNG